MLNLEVGLENEEATLDRLDGNNARSEVRVVRPGAPEGNVVRLRAHVKVGGLGELSVGNVTDVKDSKAGGVVRLVREVTLDVEVVVNRCDRRHEPSRVERLFERLDVPNVSDGATVLAVGVSGLIKLVVEEQVALVLRQPALMGVCHAVVRCERHNLGVVLVADVVDGEGVLVEGEANLGAGVSRVGATVVDTLEIVCVAVGLRTSGKLRVFLGHGCRPCGVRRCMCASRRSKGIPTPR